MDAKVVSATSEAEAIKPDERPQFGLTTLGGLCSLAVSLIIQGRMASIPISYLVEMSTEAIPAWVVVCIEAKSE